MTTYGNGANALFAQSAGGGGVGADASGLFQSASDGQSTKNAIVAINLGGVNAARGDSGPVSIEHLGGRHETHGIGFSGIVAQRVGTGGGTGGSDTVAASGTINLGGTGESEGNGGSITVGVRGGSIRTGIDADDSATATTAFGIFAQSVGGGGGNAGNIRFGSSAGFGTNLEMNDDPSTGNGDGGSVEVNVDAGSDITTFGNSSVGCEYC